ncbi:MAG: TonB-dependent receptor [Rhodothermales bacterium]
MIHRYSLFIMLLFAAFVLSAGSAYAQTGTISGQVIDADDGRPVAGANVVAFNAGGSLVNGAATDLEGRYSFTVAPGTYSLRARFVGYQEEEASVTVTAGGTVTADFTIGQQGLELNTVVVAASRRQEKALDAPASVSIIGTQEVARDVGTSSVEALRTTPGVDMQQTGVDRREMVIRGFNNAFSGAAYVLTDYRQAAVASLAVNIYSIMPNMNIDVDRIEVVRGPGSALYGAGVDAGVVHFVTKDAFAHPGTTISVQGGERSLFSTQLRHAGVIGAGGKVGYKLTGMYGQANDWELDPNDPVDAPELAATGPRDNDYSKLNVNASVEYRFSDEGSLTVNGGMSRLNSTVLSGIGTLQADDFGYNYAQVRLRLKDFFAQVYYNMTDAGDSFVYGQDLDGDGVVDPVIDNGGQLVGQVQYDMEFMGGRQNVIVGADMELIRPDTEGTILGRNENDDNIDEFGGYVQSTTALTNKLDVTVALRGDYNSVVDAFQVSPRAALVFKANNSHSFRATYNRAFSSPGTNSNFLDIVAGQVGGLITVRGRGAASGYTWERNPAFAPIAGTDLVASSLNPAAIGAKTPVGLPLDATYASVYAGLAGLGTPTIQAVLAQNGINLPAQAVAQLVALLSPQGGTNVQGFSRGLMGIVNPTTGIPAFVNGLTDIEPLDQTITQTFEVGYKGVINNKLLATVDVYYSKRKNFVGPLLMETPLVFVPNLSNDLTAAISAGIAGNAQLAGALTQFGLTPNAVAGLLVNLAGDGLPDASTPVAIVQPIENNPGVGAVPELMLTYRNFGNVDFYGSDIAIQYLASDALSLFANLSLVSDDFFDDEELEEPGSGLTLALNAPTLKGRAGFQYTFANGLSVNGSGRYVEEFPIRSGPYEGTLESYFLLDLGAGYDLSEFTPGLRLDVNVTNVTDNMHREFIGAPQLGRMAMGRLTYSF